MEDLMIASTEADATALEAMVGHHAEMAGTLATKVDVLLTSARTDSRDTTVAARDDLVAWCRAELVPHALAEEESVYPAAVSLPGARLLVEAMLVEHQILVDLVADLADAHDVIAVAPRAMALRVLFDAHVDKENDQLLPLLVATPDVSVADLLAGMHSALEKTGAQSSRGADAAGSAHGESGACGCNEHDGAGHPELDARAVPHAIRHATVFGALDAVRPGKGLVLVAPHDPLPLLRQLEGRAPGAFSVEYLQRGPEAWRLLLTRLAG